MLCDIKKVHTGYGLMPRVTHCTEDEHWGQIGGSRKVHTAKTIFFNRGEAALDTVIDRQDNQYWKIEVNNFKYWAFGFTKFVGEWFTIKQGNNSVRVTYVYTLYSHNVLAYPFHWLITKTAWTLYMRHTLKTIHHLALNKDPYVHD